MFREIRECLKLDPDHFACFPFYKKIKQVAKRLNEAESAENLREYDKCISSAQSVLKIEPDLPDVRFIAHQLLCKCYNGNSEPSEAIKECQKALKIRKEAAIYCDSAEAYLAAEMFDDGK